VTMTAGGGHLSGRSVLQEDMPHNAAREADLRARGAMQSKARAAQSARPPPP
jgi:hypothetical protein